MLEDDMPSCPTLCGGPKPKAGLTDYQQAVRTKHGCDEPCESARYAILCPACDGAGCSNEGLKEKDRYYCHEGMRWMRRCPSSFQDPALAQGLRAWRYLRDHGVLPAPGAYLDQASSFLQFASVLDSEVARVEGEQREATRKKADADTRRAKSKRR